MPDGCPRQLPASVSRCCRPRLCEEIERAAVSSRWRLRGRTHRLSRTHGDFHPWNVLFREGTDFSVLDRSRGEWGEPADDVAALGVNFSSTGSGAGAPSRFAISSARSWRPTCASRTIRRSWMSCPHSWRSALWSSRIRSGTRSFRAASRRAHPLRAPHDGRLSVRSRRRPRASGDTAVSWAIWITGLPGSGSPRWLEPRPRSCAPAAMPLWSSSSIRSARLSRRRRPTAIRSVTSSIGLSSTWPVFWPARERR